MKFINTTEAAILTVLVAADSYGSELIQRVRRVSNGRVNLTLGSAYPTLYRMEQKKLIKGYWGDDSETLNGARRRYYKVTGLGERALSELVTMLTTEVGGALEA
jgi:DNA-binding PadR family transcriptional regulator